MKKILCLLVLTIGFTAVLVSCGHEHTGGAATCESAAICSECGEEYGEPLGHDFGYTITATTHTYGCKRLGCTKRGNRAAHSGGVATCTQKAVCSECNAEYGSTKAHNFVGTTCDTYGTCSDCGAKDTKLREHDFSDATCKELSTCKDCGATTGEYGKHKYYGSTCSIPGVCTVCGDANGPTKDHNFEGSNCVTYGVCTECGANDGTYANIHNFESDTATVCSDCGIDYFAGTLEFDLSRDKTYYILNGIGNCTREHIVVPAEYNGLPVTTIGDYAFDTTQNIKSVVISEGITTLGQVAFGQCTKLETVTIPTTVNEISDFCFAYCSSLKTVNVHSGITYIGNSAFSGTAIESIVLPEGLTYLGSYAFANTCLTEITIPVGVTDIFSGTFFNAPIASVVFLSELKTIGDNAFCGITAETIVLPDSVTNVGNAAFAGNPNLVSIDLGSGIKTIGQGVFSHCPVLEYVYVGEALEKAGVNIFTESPNVKYNVYKDVRYIGSEENPYVLVIGVDKNNISVIDLHDDAIVILEEAFQYVSTATELHLGASIKYIGPFAFVDMSGLEVITVDEANEKYHSSGNSIILTAEKTLVYGCKTTVIPSDGSVTTIGNNAFAELSTISSIAIPKAVKTIECAFIFSSIKTVIIEGAREYKADSFRGCKDLTVYFIGTESEWGENVYEGGDAYNGDIMTATVYYYSENQPQTEGNFWHYVNGVPTAW